MTLNVFHTLDTVQDAREILGIVYCKTCRMDTMILEPYGICGFCEEPLREGADQPLGFVARYCRRGHWMHRGNVLVDSRGHARCSDCARENRQKYRAKKAAA